MPQTISKIGIKDSSGTGYDTRDIGAKGQNVEVGYDASGKIILDVDAQTPVTTKQLTKVLQEAEKNISDLDDNKAPDNHAWSDADSEVNHGLADATHYGHIKTGNGLTNNSGEVSVTYGTTSNTACEGNDSRLSNARKNPNAVTFSDGRTNTIYDGSSAKTVTAATVGAASAGHTTINATSSILGHVKTGTGITNNSGTISVSYGTAAGTACQGNDSRLSDARTPKSHAATATTYGSGTSSNYGHVKLTDTYSVTTPNASTNGANTGIAASAYALQQAYNILDNNLSNITTEPNKIGRLNTFNDKDHHFGMTYKVFNTTSFPVIIIDGQKFYQIPFNGCYASDGSHECFLLRTELDISTNLWRMKYTFMIDGHLYTKYINFN